MNRVSFASLIILLSVTQYLNAVTPEEIKTIYEQCLKSRSWINSYELTITGGKKYAHGKLEDRFNRYIVWSDGKSLRTEIGFSSDGVNFEKRVALSCTNCERDGYTAQTVRGDSATSVKWLRDTDGFASSNLNHVFWQYFGLKHGEPFVQKENAAYQDISDTLFHPDAKHSVEGNLLTATYMNKEKTKRVVLDLETSEPVEYFTYLAGNSTSHTTKIEYKTAGATGKLFPSKYTCVSTGKSGLLSTTEFIVNIAKINTKIEPNVFMIDSLNLVSGTPVDYPEIRNLNNSPTIQDGKVDKSQTVSKVVAEAMKQQPEQQQRSADTPKPSLISQAWPYFLGFVILSIIGFWLLRKQWQAAKEG